MVFSYSLDFAINIFLYPNNNKIWFYKFFLRLIRIFIKETVLFFQGANNCIRLLNKMKSSEEETL